MNRKRFGALVLCAMLSPFTQANPFVGEPISDAATAALFPTSDTSTAEQIVTYRKPSNFNHPRFSQPGKIRADASTAELATTLTAAYHEYDFQSFKDNQSFIKHLQLRKYNGLAVGPTLIARPGDTLRIKLVNQLPPETHPACNEEGHCDHNQPHNFNTINLHTHGLHVDPTGNSDNVFIRVTSGETFDYEIRIPPDHVAGTFWYHAHVHGASTVQMGSGMAGTLIVKGDYDRIPAIRAAKKKVMMLQEIAFDASGTIENNDTFAPLAWSESARANGWHISINGKVMPEIHLQPSATELWRFVQAGVRKNIRLALLDPCSNERIPLVQLAADGIAFESKRLAPDYSVRMAPGYRSDVMVKIPQRGVYYLVDVEDDPHFALPPQYCYRNAANRHFALDEKAQDILARVVVSGTRQFGHFPSNLALQQLQRPRDIQDEELSPMVEYLEFDIDLASDPWVGLINGKPFDPAYPRILKLNTAQTWQISSAFSHHPYHIHVNPFQVIIRDERGQITDRFWKDTLLIEQLNAEQSNKVEVRTRYEDYSGAFVTHCHILDHQDRGMMEKIVIEP